MVQKRNVEKNLACAEDLAFGETPVSQTRNGGSYNMTGIRGFWPVNSQAEFDALDPVRFPKACLVAPNAQGKLTLDFYAYVSGGWMLLGTTGTDVGTVLKSVVFKRSTAKPALPTAGDFDNPVPPGWSDGVPDGELTLWATTRVFTSNGQPPQQSTWTAVAQMTDTETLDYEWSSVEVPGNPTDNPDNWSDTPDSNTLWQALRTKTNGVFGAWGIIRVKGEAGDDGTPANDSFKSTIFKRSDSQPDVPTGGSYDDPVAQGWSDGVPGGEAILWGSNRIFTKNGQAPQQAVWSTPAQMTDTETLDYEWSSHPTDPGTPETQPDLWSNTPDTSTIWQALRRKVNGVYGAWEVIRVRGEDGKDGEGARYGGWYNISSATGAWDDALAASACPNGTPIKDDVVTIYKLTDTAVANTKRFDGSTWITPGLVIHGDILSPGTVRGDRIVAGSEIISPVIKGGVVDGAQMQSVGPNVMLVTSSTPFGPDALIEWKGNKIVDGNNNPILSSLTKANATIQWVDANGSSYFGGALSAGILRTASTNPTKAEYNSGESVVEIGPFSTNGGQKNIIVSFNYNAGSVDNTPTCPTNPTQFSFSWRLERKIGSGSWTQVLTGAYTGVFRCDPGEPDPGQSALYEAANGSTTFLDADSTVDDFNYRLVCTGYARFMATSNVSSQEVTLVSSEG